MNRYKHFLIGMLIVIILAASSVYAAQYVQVIYPDNPVIYNTTMTSANTEYSQALPGGCKKFTAQCRGAYDVKLAFASGESGTTYYTVKADTWYWEDEIEGTTRTLYFQCGTTAQVFEVIVWY